MSIRQIARNFARRFVPECELMLEGLPVLIGTDQSRMRYEPRHTTDRPFCDDHRCPCHIASDYGRMAEEQLYRQIIGEPFQDGLLTVKESIRLYWGENI